MYPINIGCIIKVEMHTRITPKKLKREIINRKRNCYVIIRHNELEKTKYEKCS
jgi:hypothetical protein